MTIILCNFHQFQITRWNLKLHLFVIFLISLQIFRQHLYRWYYFVGYLLLVYWSFLSTVNYSFLKIHLLWCFQSLAFLSQNKDAPESYQWCPVCFHTFLEITDVKFCNTSNLNDQCKLTFFKSNLFPTSNL